METGTRETCDLVFAQFSAADNMTDASAALSILADFDCGERTRALERIGISKAFFAYRDSIARLGAASTA